MHIRNFLQSVRAGGPAVERGVAAVTSSPRSQLEPDGDDCGRPPEAGSVGLEQAPRTKLTVVRPRWREDLAAEGITSGSGEEEPLGSCRVRPAPRELGGDGERRRLAADSVGPRNSSGVEEARGALRMGPAPHEIGGDGERGTTVLEDRLGDRTLKPAVGFREIPVSWSDAISAKSPRGVDDLGWAPSHSYSS